MRTDEQELKQLSQNIEIPLVRLEFQDEKGRIESTHDRKVIDETDDALLLSNYYLCTKQDKKMWSTYLYMRWCINQSTELGNNYPVNALLKFLDDKKNKQWLTRKLMNTPYSDNGDVQNTGYHEWLSRHLISSVIKRSIGKEPGVQKRQDLGLPGCYLDWLSIQALVRTRIKYIIFHNFNAHTPAIKKSIASRGNKGALTKGSYEFHQKLDQCFEKSKTIFEFLQGVKEILLGYVTMGCLNETVDERIIADGTRTNDTSSVNTWRNNQFKHFLFEIEMIEGYENLNAQPTI